ncbi:beta-1,3-galactosyltransferase 1-like [Anneissia japonica]|uniref:beta-1,3-galactosyltransferase 1-like n=1 Tax=Anneissia japonica TaxID=1529436 RepID=UPI0014256690|nr:beta-1,3-galactosyltransferase 1-like [Anneissia japonica]XP_033098041.1 beta-1,3-galactosyltransferase 1-like [Anneissia japonica]XP_033098042.1 beta-1,3-galactosyltransferase 1-like [Anneissia japonica]XP_033098043.1 beta-1,3-galactosyltransferase 1-like [Anneissia japonica]XP_033098044.1 beta-1,3-galactosyltransferase 1-like [Anneissia japonica]
MRRKRIFFCVVCFSFTVSLGLLRLIFGPLLFLSQVAPPRVNGNVYEVSRPLSTNTNQTNSKLRLPHDFKLVINNPETCRYNNGTEKDVYLLVLVLTMHKNKNQRQVIRNTWSSPKEIEGKKIVTMFLLGNISDQTLVNLVRKENEIHSDILMEDFKDTYANLTLKTIMGMKWATMFCPQAKYVMKTDDDMFVHYGNIIKYLNSLSREMQTKLAVGKLMKSGPIRNKKSKWYMPKEWYPKNKYPPFLSGTGYIVSADVARDTYIQSQNATFLYLEDVFCATVWEQLGIVPRNMIEFHNTRIPYSICRYKKIITSHQLSLTQLSMIWKDLKVNKAKC